ncbi:prepilin-type N-terminal cleavage/methylation domain-containing protein [Candidatus Gracilibacteria bacterium]|nr:prepilin-type N-terminal cleavage/methylation domain-containing protein [Candidatus Gracilibacteria bacterium]
MNRRGFTLLEILISLTIIIILTAAALSGSRSLTSQLQLNNAMDKVTFMVQRARALAISNKNTDNANEAKISAYGVVFSFGEQPQNTVRVFAEKESSANRIIDQDELAVETFTFNPSSAAVTALSDAQLPCNNFAVIMFEVGTAKTSLYCNDRVNSANMLYVKARAGTSEKQFFIHRAAGIIQY